MIPISVSLAVLLPVFEPPLDPDRDEARRWAAEELSKPRYESARPNWLDDIWRQLIEWLRSLNSGDSPGGPDIAATLVGTIAVVLIIVAVIVVRPRLNARHNKSTEVFDSQRPADAGAFRARASAAAGRGDWQTAVVEQFRAVVRSAEDRGVIDPQAGRTADEAATQLGRAFGAATSRLNSAARLFDSVKYGRATAAAADYADVLDLDTELSTMKPDFAGQGSNGLAVPR